MHYLSNFLVVCDWYTYSYDYFYAQLVLLNLKRASNKVNKIVKDKVATHHTYKSLSRHP